MIFFECLIEARPQRLPKLMTLWLCTIIQIKLSCRIVNVTSFKNSKDVKNKLNAAPKTNPLANTQQSIPKVTEQRRKTLFQPIMGRPKSDIPKPNPEDVVQDDPRVRSS